MNAYKKLKKQDSYFSTYVSHKQWAVSSSDFESYGIQTRILTGSYFNKIKHLYYPSYYGDSDIMVSHSYDHHYSSTLYTNARRLVSGSFMISLPRDIIGDYLEPLAGLSFSARVSAPPDEYFQDQYITDNYYAQPSKNDPSPLTSASIDIVDNGQGRLTATVEYDTSTTPTQLGYMGDIIYSHGHIIVTDKTYSPSLTGSDDMVVRWRSIHPIYTHNYHCTVEPNEFLFTQNPSATSTNKETLNANVSGEDFTPYITTVGLYNEANELLAVAKLGQPLSKPKNTNLTIVVKIDF